VSLFRFRDVLIMFTLSVALAAAFAWVMVEIVRESPEHAAARRVWERRQ
jgi:hypothetical protein